MTKEEIIQGLYKGDSRAIKEAIKALEQQPSDDCVSRQAVKDIIHKYKNNIDSQLSWLFDGVCNLPPVTPTFPSNATNGDMIKAMFPNAKTWEITVVNITYVCVAFEGMLEIKKFTLEWWNAPYKRGNSDGSN